VPRLDAEGFTTLTVDLTKLARTVLDAVFGADSAPTKEAVQ
jgi:hypothetical protein